VKELTHLSLFSGIGGADLAAEWAGFQTIGFVEIDPFCQKVLKKHWPAVPIIGDIRDVTRESFARGGVQEEVSLPARATSDPYQREGRPRNVTQPRTEEIAEPGSDHPDCVADAADPNGIGEVGQQPENRQGQRAVQNYIRPRPAVTLLTGGFPCQPFSAAGKRKGKSDNRYLWPQMLRVIKIFRPTWIIGENVNGLTSMVEFDSEPEVDSRQYTEEEMGVLGGALGRNTGRTFERTGRGVLDEIVEALEEAGYEVQPVIIPACAVGAVHKRSRIFIIAHLTNPNIIGLSGGDPGEVERIHGWREHNALQAPEPDRDAADSGELPSRSRLCESDPGGVGGRQSPDSSGEDRVDRDPLGEAVHPLRSVRQGQDSQPGRIDGVAPDTQSIENNERNRGSLETSLRGGESGDPATGVGDQYASDPIIRHITSQEEILPRGYTAGLCDQPADAGGCLGVDSIGSCLRAGIECPAGLIDGLRWNENWVTVATRFCRVDDGVSGGLDRVADRVERLKALGNAIVPQQLYPILQAIADIENGITE
jgi:DNA (cytosine-5)-methyltransferase 1